MTPSPQPDDALLTPENTQAVVPPGGTDITMTRVIHAPRERVFAAWTDPLHLSQWFGPAGFTLTHQCFAFREGGLWRFTMHGPDGTDYANRVQFEVVDAPRRLVYRQDDDGSGLLGDDAFQTEVLFDELPQDDPSLPAHTRVTVTLTMPSNALRDMVITQFGAVEGGKECWARLARHVETSRYETLSAEHGHPLTLQRILPVDIKHLWRAWTEPELLAQWWCPKPWYITDVSMDVQPGGHFSCVMRGPDGEQMPTTGCYLDVQPQRRLVFTDLMRGGWQPVDDSQGLMGFTAVTEFEVLGPKLTRYTARALHRTLQSREGHDQMGFHAGWGTACDQLVELALTLDVE